MPPDASRANLVVVTGASAGIGAALARELSRRGRPVLAVARRVERLQALAAEARAANRAEIHALALDVSKEGAAEKVLAASREHGGASWLVNNAGFGGYGRFENQDPRRLAEMIRVNCESLVLLAHAFIPDLRATRQGVLLNVASAAAFQPIPYMSVYAATKAFVLSFTEGLSEELRASGVFVGAYCPGPVSTEFGEVAGTHRRYPNPLAVLTADDAAKEALRQIRRKDVVHVPKLVYRLGTSAVRFVPRGVLRRVAGRVNEEER
jgi:short-subunit dehydrogenase